MTDSQDGKQRYIFRVSLTGPQRHFLIGVVISLLGFALPWFKSGWQWYGGWTLKTWDDFAGIVILIFISYGLLLLGGIFLHRLFFMEYPNLIGLGVVLSLTVVMAIFIVVSMAIADAISGIYRDGLVWGIGIFVMLPGHAMMIWGALTIWMVSHLSKK